MKKKYNVIIADRNRRVRELLKREMSLAGYLVWLAKDGSELMRYLTDDEAMDVLILDPDFPDIEENVLFDEITDQFPLLPIILHTHVDKEHSSSISCNTVVFVEKQGNSIDLLVKKTFDLLQNGRTAKKVSGRQ